MSFTLSHVGALNWKIPLFKSRTMCIAFDLTFKFLYPHQEINDHHNGLLVSILLCALKSIKHHVQPNILKLNSRMTNDLIESLTLFVYCLLLNLLMLPCSKFNIYLPAGDFFFQSKCTNSNESCGICFTF